MMVCISEVDKGYITILDEIEHLAYCGFDCGKCPIYAHTDAAVSPDPADAQGGVVSSLPPGSASGRCPGCRADAPEVHKFCAECEYRICARGRGHGNCGECDEYPCERIRGNTALSSGSIAVLDAVHKACFGRSEPR